jgi:hypothetical protein
MIIVWVLFVVLLAGCGETRDISNVGSASDLCKPVDYGNNVLYFPCVAAAFAKSLSKYLGENQSKEVAVMTYNDIVLEGLVIGYFVVVRSKGS